VRPILDAQFPGLPHSAALIGYGSDVLGFDTPRSTDHEWGPRAMLFLGEENHAALASSISDALTARLPTSFRGYSTSFAEADANGVRVAEAAEAGNVRHHVRILTAKEFFRLALNIEPDRALHVRDWLVFSEQKLLEVTSGAVFHDGLGELNPVRTRLSYYPHQVWLYLLAAQWMRIDQEEPFVGRAGEAGDELGSQIIAARLVRDLMRLCFLMEHRYAPYNKWLGTAFARLDCGSELGAIFSEVMASRSWKERERHMCAAYEKVATMHNKLGITSPIETGVRRFHDRPYLVLGGARFAKAISDTIEDPELRKIYADVGPIGSVNQFIDNTNVLTRADLLARAKPVFA
jgi:hypothetical protein